MVEREFFRGRNTIPGSLFLLLVISLNRGQIFELIQDLYPYLKGELVSGIALALFGVFGITIIGFIMTQLWFLIFWLGRLLGFLLLRAKNPAHVFLSKNKNIIENVRTLQAITDYIGIISDKRISAYLERRLDLVHTLGSSIISVASVIYITKVILHSEIDFSSFVFLAIFFIAMAFSAVLIHLENLKMVEYIVLLEGKYGRLSSKIPREYKKKNDNMKYNNQPIFTQSNIDEINDNKGKNQEHFEAVKIALQWCDSRVNGSFAAMIAVSLGAFGILRLYSEVNGLQWVALTIAYFLVGSVGVYLIIRAVYYSSMANLKGSRTFPNGGTNQVFTDMKNEVLTEPILAHEYQRTSVRIMSWKHIDLLIGLIILSVYILAWLAVAV